MNAFTSTVRHPRSGRLGTAFWLLLTTLAVGQSVPARGADAKPAADFESIDDGLIGRSRKLLRILHDKGYHRVGVLKFRAQDGNGSTSFHVGPINTNLAERLENSLVLAIEDKQAITILHDVSTVAAEKKQHIDYTTAAGRKKLFDLKYPSAVGEQHVAADAFLTGVVHYDAKIHQTKVSIQLFDKTSADLATVLEFTAHNDRSVLSDFRKGFVLAKRSLLTHRGVENDADADADATARETKTKESVASSKEKLIEFKAYYDNTEYAPQDDPNNPGDSKFTINDPKQGQAVHFTIKNISDKRVAVVLRINGENTLKQEKDEAVKCTKWVLDPKDPELKIEGYYINDSGKDNLLPINVLSDEESNKQMEELNNSQDGLIDVHVFVEGSDKPEDSDKLTARGISRRAYKNTKRGLKSTDDLRKKLLQSMSKSKKRGLMRAGTEAKDGGTLKSVEFKDPQEQMHMVIQYFKKGGSSSGNTVSSGN